MSRDTVDATALRLIMAQSCEMTPEALDRLLPTATWERGKSYLNEYLRGRPVAYLLGDVSFLGRRFRSDERALAIRTYSETLVQRALEDYRGHRVRAIEVGCGAAPALCTLAAELDGDFFGTDVDPLALELAAENADRYVLPVSLVCGDLFAGIPGPFDFVYSSLPWEDPGTELPESKWEPNTALYDPEGGHTLIHRFLDQVVDLLVPGGRLYLELPDDEALRDRVGGEDIYGVDGDAFGRAATRESVIAGTARAR